MAPLIDDTAMDLDLSLSGHDHVTAEKISFYDALHRQSSGGRRVAFFDSVVVYEISNSDSFTPEEIKSCWYDRVDLRQIKENAKHEARLIENGLLQENDDVCFRGLECRTKEGSRGKRHNRANANAAVFFELDTQDDRGIYDDEAVADAYFNHSERCQVSAQMIGMRDAREAQVLLLDTKLELVGCSPVADQDVIILLTSEGLISSAA
jgi:hypothetical protein